MVTACGFCFYHVAFFHLIMHAFFKALLFLGAGSIIHSLNDEQDIRKMGGLFFKMPITFYAMLIGTLSLIGFPFTSGYYSKDMLLELIYQEGSYLSNFAYFFGVVSVFFTAFYSFRSLILVFFTTPRGSKAVYLHMVRNSYYLLLPLIILALISLFGGYFSFDYFFLQNNFFFVEQRALSGFIKLLPLILNFVAFVCVYYIYVWNPIGVSNKFFSSKLLKEFYYFLNKKWYVDVFYNTFFGWIIWSYSYTVSFCFIEKGWLEWLGPTGLLFLINQLSLFFNRILTTNLIDYFFYFLMSIIFIFFYLF
jgi:NADH-ubiquinone oxidoreductase chain 5